MRRFPISWDKTLAQLGFKRRVNRVKRDHYRRKNSRIEPLEVRAMLSVSPGEAPDDQTLSVASFGTDTGRVELLRPEFVLADSAAGDTPDQFEITTEYPDKGSPRAVIKLKEGLERIEPGAQDEREYVKKGVNMALRAVGKRNRPLNQAAIRIAKRLSKSAAAAPRWVGSHALRELESAAVQKRFADH